MRRSFKYGLVSNRLINEYGYRMDCSPYIAGAIEAKEKIKTLLSEPLKSLTKGHNGGIFNGPKFVRNYVNDRKHGVPFLTTTSMLQLDMTNLPLLSRIDAYSSKLSYLRVEEGMTLISCSGSIGEMVYARKDMVDTWSNQDILKVVADRERILPGYLFAFLSGIYGLPLVLVGTYGSIIQHIEPHHISDLPVPRLGNLEIEVHDLVQKSADLIAEANGILQSASERYLASARLDILPIANELPNIGFVADVDKRSLRAMNYLPKNKALETAIKNKAPSWRTLEQLTVPGTLRSGPRFKRIDADPDYGVELIGQEECFHVRPSGRWISKEYLKPNSLLFPVDGTIMIAAQGCAGEYDLFGRAQFITGKRLKYAYSQHFLRIVANADIIPHVSPLTGFGGMDGHRKWRERLTDIPPGY